MFGGTKKWSERRIKPKKCRECLNIFKPSCGGNLYCIACTKKVKRRNAAKNTRNSRLKNPMKYRRNKANWDLKRFGITIFDYENMFTAQKGCCAICRTDKPKGKGVYRIFALDHCHKTGKIRSLLCHRCNGALGMVSDSQEILARMVSYLKEHADG